MEGVNISAAAVVAGWIGGGNGPLPIGDLDPSTPSAVWANNAHKVALLLLLRVTAVLSSNGSTPSLANLSALLPLLAASSVNPSLITDPTTNTTVLSLALVVSVAWEAGLRMRLPPLIIPIDSFAANHRSLLAGGPGGVYCPAGTGWPVNVPAGYVSTSTPAAAAAAPAGSNLTRDGITPAPPGWYAVAGAAHPCGAGVYGAAAGGRSRWCDGWCPAGRACPLGTAVPIPCGVGEYAEQGSGACIQCLGVGVGATRWGESSNSSADDGSTGGTDGYTDDGEASRWDDMYNSGVCRTSRRCCEALR